MPNPLDKLTQAAELNKRLNQEQEALKKKRITDENIKKAAALDTRDANRQESALEDEQLAAANKETRKERLNYFLSTAPRPKPEGNRREEDETAGPKPSLTPVSPSAKVEYFASNVVMPNYEKDLAALATKAGLDLTPVELLKLTKELGGQARKVNEFIADLYQGLKDGPLLKMAVVNGQLGLILEGSKEQIKAISEGLGIKMNKVDKKDVTAEANFSAAPAAATSAPPTPKPLVKVKPDGEKELKWEAPQPSSLSTTPRPSPYKKIY